MKTIWRNLILLLCIVHYTQGENQELFKNSNDQVLGQRDWGQVVNSVDRGLNWLAKNQNADGSFTAKNNFQPGITSLAVMAFLSAGHTPGEGKYGKLIERGIEYTLSCQNSEGIFTKDPIPPQNIWYSPSHTSTYTHAITGLMLAEVYGQAHIGLNIKIHSAIEKALKYTIKLHHDNKRPSRPEDVGGWRYTYIIEKQADADLSVTGWHMMFLRAADGAGFNIEKSEIDSTVEYVKRCFYQPKSEFSYYANRGVVTSAMTGAGALCLVLTGNNEHEYCKKAGKWLKDFNYKNLSSYKGGEHRVFPFYAAYYCSQAASQLGGDVWRSVYPQIVSFLQPLQKSDGSWKSQWLGSVGDCYSTSLAILSITTQNQFLPMVQR